MSVIAITGGTGFVGAHLIRMASDAGHGVRALTRRDQPPQPGVTWIDGSLSDRQALAALVAGADAVIHVAGAISASDRDGFHRINVSGTQAMIEAAHAADVSRFIHVSSLAAREPDLSNYGWSKAESEALVQTSGLDWTIVRPPAVYGPGDRETLSLFEMARRGWVALPPRGRLSLIHVRDLCDLLLACLNIDATIGKLYEPDDGTHNGLSHIEFARALGRAQDRIARPVSLPGMLVRAGARLDRLVRRGGAKLTPDRARYFCHPDWVADPQKQPDPAHWKPAILLDNGLRDTARWYREQGWLRR